MKHLLLKVSLFTSISLFPTILFAGMPNPIGSLVFSIPATANSPTAVPSLSGTMLVVLSLLLFVVAFRVARQKNAKAGKLFLTLLGVGALSSGIGVNLISKVDAGATQETVTLSVNVSSTTGSAPLYDNFGPTGNPGFVNYFDNPFSVPATITAINYDMNVFSCGLLARPDGLLARPIDTSAPICTVGNTIPANGGQCRIQCFAIQTVSDIRLKQDITFLTKLKNGIKLYSFKYLPSFTSDNTSYVGVMAQDLLKDSRYKNSVKTMNNGFYGVNYQALGLEMVTLENWQKTTNNERN